MPELRTPMLKLNDGMDIPQLGLGTWEITGKQCENAVKWALEIGYRHIDTAKIYGNEIEVGNAIKNSGIPRKEIFVTTKLWNDDHDDIESAFEKSLKNLQMDYVDLYLMHYPVQERLRSWAIMEKILRSGKAKSIGVSNFTISHLKSLLEVADVVPVVNQVEFHPLLYQKDLSVFCKNNRILLEAYSPLTRGRRLKDDRFTNIASRYGKSNAQLLIRWALQHGLIVIPKSHNMERINENFSVFDFNISDDDMSLLDATNENLRFCWDPSKEL